MFEKKAKKEKPTYSLLSNVIYIFALLWKYNKSLFAFILLLIPLTLGKAYFDIYLPRLTIAIVLNGESVNYMIMAVGLIGIIIAVFNVSNKFIDTCMWAVCLRFNSEAIFLMQKKELYTDYANTESSKYRSLKTRMDNSELFFMYGPDSGFTRIPRAAGEFVTSIIGYFLFGAILSFASPWIAVLLTCTALINYFVMKAIQNYQYKHRHDTSYLDKKSWYIVNNSGRFEYAKDIRLYGMNKWFTNIYKTLTKKRLKWDKKFAGKRYISNIIDACIILLRDGLAYVVLIYLFMDGSITVDNFIMYFLAVGTFANWVSGIINAFIEMNGISLSVCDFRDFLNYPEKNNRDKGCALQDFNLPYEIELKNMSYRYEGADKDTLSDISLKIKPGEKIAIVGLNGAGKTTLIKNICGLYSTTAGSIKVNGNNVSEYNIYDYYSMFSVVFQDLHFCPVSIANVVSGTNDEQTDKARAVECIKFAELSDKIKQLDDGIDTMLNKQINEEAVDMSGGEKQKLLLARAIYKNAPILILDEPTSALDPIAESKLYEKYNELTKDKTSIFISHRLASTRFCDRILYMEDGRITEEGTHDELIKSNGRYAYLFDVQSHYYTDNIENINEENGGA